MSGSVVFSNEHHKIKRGFHKLLDAVFTNVCVNMKFYKHIRCVYCLFVYGALFEDRSTKFLLHDKQPTPWTFPSKYRLHIQLVALHNYVTCFDSVVQYWIQVSSNITYWRRKICYCRIIRTVEKMTSWWAFDPQWTCAAPILRSFNVQFVVKNATDALFWYPSVLTILHTIVRRSSEIISCTFRKSFAWIILDALTVTFKLSRHFLNSGNWRRINLRSRDKNRSTVNHHLARYPSSFFINTLLCSCLLTDFTGFS